MKIRQFFILKGMILQENLDHQKKMSIRNDNLGKYERVFFLNLSKLYMLV